MSELVDALADRGFEEIEDAGLPGGWATDGEWTVAIRSRMTGVGGIDHEVRVYDREAGLISIGTTPVGRGYGSGHALAVREALEDGGYMEGED
ncbi:hypothetical protein [Haloarcula amylolytica]|uniref:Uncharacterized protein n=1 Tax=Haloarcula amylolytica JCM 13557 TaxID=1227452 RepID=M0KBE2_9EURY|nr:hypothetical protein [Haloarcula amylolytica]EMA17165.1 hypothetical protein C442_17885 [Haloarcula amylolytica JCM 13557]